MRVPWWGSPGYSLEDAGSMSSSNLRLKFEPLQSGLSRQRSAPTGAIWDRPLASPKLPPTTAIPAPACVDRPCAVNEEDFGKSTGCGVFPHWAGIACALLTAVELPQTSKPVIQIGWRFT